MNVCLEVLKLLPPGAAKRALKHRRFYHGGEWAKDGIS